MTKYEEFARSEAHVEAHRAYWNSPTGDLVKSILLEHVANQMVPKTLPPLVGLRAEFSAQLNDWKEGAAALVRFIELLKSPKVASSKTEEPKGWEYAAKTAEETVK